jgi:CheY-like chemotaxis protein
MWDRDAARLMAETLRQGGEAVEIAPDATAAWERLKADQVGVVILDLTSPQVEEMMLLRMARSCEKTMDVPFLFLIRADSPPPGLPPLGSEVVRDGWLALPCPPQQFVLHAKKLLGQVLHQRQANGLGRAAEETGGAQDQPASSPPPPPTLRLPEITAQGAGPIAFAGQLDALNVTSILSLVEPLKLTGVLTVSDGKHHGSVHFAQGAVTHAQLMDIEGPDALFLLFHMKKGSFRFEFGQPSPVRTIQGNTTMLLLEGLRHMDTARAVIQEYKQRRRRSVEQAQNQERGM